MVVVIDTNVWISGIFFRHGIPGRVLEAWSAGTFEVVFTSETFTELEITLKRKVAQFGAEPALAEEWLAYISTFSQTISVSVLISGASRDPRDDKILEAAVNGRARYLISGDKDLLSIGTLQRVEMKSPAEFLAILGY
jgi:putative PIN family toxin of toxin-antitoxin system